MVGSLMSNPTKSDKAYWQRLADVVGCCICRFYHDIYNNHVSPHHIDGKTKPGAHSKVIMLCGPHHQTGGEGVAIHPFKKTWERAYAPQCELKKKCDDMLGNK